MTDEIVHKVTDLLGYQTELPQETIEMIRLKAEAVDLYLTEIGVSEKNKKDELYYQTLAIGVNDLMETNSRGFSGMFERLSVTLR